MQFKYLVFALLGSAFAQKEVFLTQLQAIQTAIDSYDAGIKGLAPGIDKAAATSALTAKSGAVLGAINSAIAAIGSAQPLDLVGASAIVAPSNALVAGTEATIADLIAKKDLIVGAKQSGAVLSSLKSQADAATKLADTISSKVPADAKAIAKSVSGKVSAALNKGVAAFS